MKNSSLLFNNRKLKYTSFLVCLLASPLATSQANEIELNAGKALYKDKCARCHSKLIGRKITGSPKLTKLNKDFIVIRLNTYTSDKGNYSEEQKYKQKMIETAKGLSDNDIRNIAAYLSEK